MLQTDDGAIWVGTKSGVDRYNGRTMRNYILPTQQVYSDAGGHVIRLIRSPRGTLMAYDNKGKIFVYSTRLDRFTLLHNLTDRLQGSGIVNEMAVDGQGHLWLGLTNGTYMLRANGRGRWVTRGAPVNHLRVMGNDILVCNGQAISLYSPSSNRLRTMASGISALTTLVDHNTHTLWVGTFHNGVRVYDMRTWREQRKPSLLHLPHNPVRSIRALNATTMLYGIDGAGVYASDAAGREVWPLFNADDETQNALRGNGIYDICIDRSGNIWMGSYTGGVDRAMPVGDMLEVVRHEYLNSQSLINNGVNDVMQSADGLLWFATDHGVSILDPRTRQWRHALPERVCLTLNQLTGGEVLVGTYGNGIYALRADGQSRAVYKDGKGRIGSDYVFSLLTDNGGGLWVGTLDGDLVYKKSGHTTYFKGIREVQTIAETADRRQVAVGTTNGFYLIDRTTLHARKYFVYRNQTGPDRNSFVHALFFADAHRVWVGTDGGGIYLYDLSSGRTRQFTTANGLPSNTVYALQPDSRGRLWASTDQGLATIDRRNGEVTNVSFLDGLEREYRRMAMARLADGRLVFGSSSGAVVVNPLHIGRLNYHATLRITDVALGGLDSSLRPAWRERIATMLDNGRLKLAHDENTLDIDFESINYTYQSDILYSHRLEGFERDWSKPSPLQTVHYANLPPGSYTLHLQSISRNTGRTLDSRDLDIYIAHPWWDTWLARILYATVLLALAYLVWRNYRDRLERRYDDEKIRFFTHTAHDIRTPLSLTLAPLSDIAQDPDLSSRSSSFLDMARRNGDNLLKLVNQLLDFQKSEEHDYKPHLQPIDLHALLSTQTAKFALLARQKGITLAIDRCTDGEVVWLDADMADKIFDNLLSNAIKYTHPQGNVRLAAWTEGHTVRIDVSDTGIGIPVEAQEHIFQRFYRAENAVDNRQTGSGLGLMLTRRLVELQQGRLTFVSEAGKGTTFQLSFPRHAEGHVATADGARDTLLFVDDNAELRQYIVMALGNHYHVVTADSAEQALSYLDGGLCDIVVSDVMMPGMQGDELCRRIKDNDDTSWLPVILLTAKSGRDFIIDGMGQGADDYITKPFDTAVLRSKIDAMLANRRRLSRYYLSRSLQVVQGAADATSHPAARPDGADTHAADGSPADDAMLDDHDRSFIETATQVVIDHLADTDFNIDQLCAEMAMSRTLFYGRLKSLTAQGPQEFIRNIRLERAAMLLRQGTPVLDVSVKTGFVNAKYFSTIFKKHFGVPPSKFC